MNKPVELCVNSAKYDNRVLAMLMTPKSLGESNLANIKFLNSLKNIVTVPEA